MSDAERHASTDVPVKARRLPSPGCLFALTLLVIVASVGGWIGCRVHRQHTRLEYFEHMFSDVHTRPADPVWLHGLVLDTLGETCARRFTVIERLQYPESEFDDIGMQQVAELTNLAVLDLSFTGVTDNGLQHLRAVENLRELSLERTSITDEGLRYLVDFTSLKLLYLSDTQIGDAGLMKLHGLTQLKTLWLDNTDVTDAGLLELVVQHPHLTSLHLNQTAVSDAGIEHLSRFHDLKLLYILGTQITEEGVDQLRLQLPSCDVIDEVEGYISPPPPTEN